MPAGYAASKIESPAANDGGRVAPPPRREPHVDIRKSDTAVVFIDPQNEVLSEKGANWGAVVGPGP
jgi:hypothetical protein